MEFPVRTQSRKLVFYCLWLELSRSHLCWLACSSHTDN